MLTYIVQVTDHQYMSETLGNLNCLQYPKYCVWFCTKKCGLVVFINIYILNDLEKYQEK